MRIALLSRFDGIERVHQDVAGGAPDSARQHGLCRSVRPGSWWIGTYVEVWRPLQFQLDLIINFHGRRHAILSCAVDLIGVLDNLILRRI